MAEKKQTRNSTPTAKKSTRSAKPQAIDENRASETVSTAEATVATARNAVIEGNAAIDLDAVRQRAYELYEERGGQHGLHEDDWYRAEQEVRARTQDQQIPPQKKSA